MISNEALRAEYAKLQGEGTRLAGRLSDLPQRATVYRQLFRDSGRNHVFPLIAAHGALWAKGYFRRGLAMARTLVWQYFYSALKRADQLTALAEFADAFREVNRLVCVDTYANFHFTDRFGEASAACVSHELLEQLLRLHAARRAGREIDDDQKLELFRAHFLDEQSRVVGPRIEQALSKFQWPVLKFIALRPTIRFAYFPEAQRLRFRDFSDRDERVSHGMSAFEIGRCAGWDAVELALVRYDLLADRFFTQPEANYASLRLAAGV